MVNAKLVEKAGVRVAELLENAEKGVAFLRFSKDHIKEIGKITAENGHEVSKLSKNPEKLAEFLSEKTGDPDLKTLLKETGPAGDALRAALAHGVQKQKAITNIASEYGRIGKNGDPLDFLEKMRTDKTVFKDLNHLSTQERQELINGMKNAAKANPDVFKTKMLDTAENAKVYASKLGNAFNAMGAAKETAGKTWDVTGGKAWEFTRGAFTKPGYYEKTSEGLKPISWRQANALRANGNEDLVTEGARQFSKLRTGATVSGLLVANNITDGALTDGAVAIVTSSFSPVAWVVKETLGGGVETLSSVVGPTTPGLEAPGWLAYAADYDPDKDGHLLRISGQDDNYIPSEDEYEKTYKVLTKDNDNDMTKVMKPETFAKMRSGFVTAQAVWAKDLEQKRLAEEAAAKAKAEAEANGTDAGTGAESSTPEGSPSSTRRKKGGLLGWLSDKAGDAKDWAGEKLEAFNQLTSNIMVFRMIGDLLGMVSDKLGKVFHKIADKVEEMVMGKEDSPDVAGGGTPAPDKDKNVTVTGNTAVPHPTATMGWQKGDNASVDMRNQFALSGTGGANPASAADADLDPKKGPKLEVGV